MISGLSINVIKNIVLHIAEPLMFMCNMSLSYGYFSQRMTIAKVMSIHKSGDKHIFTNYRPVSLLQQLQTILEKMC